MQTRAEKIKENELMERVEGLSKKIRKKLGIKPTGVGVESVDGNGTYRAKFSPGVQRKYPSIGSEAVGSIEAIIEIVESAFRSARLDEYYKRVQRRLARALNVPTRFISLQPVDDAGNVSVRFKGIVVDKNPGLVRTFTGTLDSLFQLVGIEAGVREIVYA